VANRNGLQVKVGVTFAGPWFERDPKLTFRANVLRLMDEVASFGQTDIQARIRALPPAGVRTGHTADLIEGRTRSLVGKGWAVTAVVSPNTSGLGANESIATMAAASEIESRAHVFRRGASDLRKFKRDMETELMKGLE
jgi:hypothetical protein